MDWAELKAREIVVSRIKKIKNKCEGHWLGEDSIGSWFTCMKNNIVTEVADELRKASVASRSQAFEECAVIAESCDVCMHPVPKNDSEHDRSVRVSRFSIAEAIRRKGAEK